MWDNAHAMDALPARIALRIDRSGGPDACWTWTGARLKRKCGEYGVVWVEGKAKKAHRVVWEAAFGRIPDATPMVLHRCDNPPCCNPAHLFLGTSTDNARDRDQKGRRRGGPGRVHGPPLPSRAAA